VRTAVLDNLWLADLTQMQATYARPEGQGGFQRSADSGRCPAEYLALFPSHTARVITSARRQALRDGFAIGSEKFYQCAMHYACMHVQSDTMVAAVHRMLQCAAMASNVAQFKDKDFGQSMDWDAS
jgi:hypothetical protein